MSKVQKLGEMILGAPKCLAVIKKMDEIGEPKLIYVVLEKGQAIGEIIGGELVGYVPLSKFPIFEGVTYPTF